MRRKLLLIIGLLVLSQMLYANPSEKQEGEARWQKIVTLKNASLTEDLLAEAARVSSGLYHFYYQNSNRPMHL